MGDKSPDMNISSKFQIYITLAMKSLQSNLEIVVTFFTPDITITRPVMNLGIFIT